MQRIGFEQLVSSRDGTAGVLPPRRTLFFAVWHRVAPRRGRRAMAANHFVLNGSGVQVDYTIGANPSFTALTYKSGAVVKAFNPRQIQTNTPGPGERSR